MNQREKLASENGMTIEYVNWFFDHKKDGCGNVWFMMMAAMWEGWDAREAQVKQLSAENAQWKEAVSGELIFEEMQRRLAAKRYVNEEINSEWLPGDDSQLGVEFAIEFIESQVSTGATDAFLSRLRAEGVEMFVAETSAGLRTSGGALGVIQEPYHEFADHLEDRGERFAKRLREGKAGEVVSE